MFGILRRWRRTRLMKEAFPAAWLAILEEKVPFFSSMKPTLHARFLGQLRVFVEEKHFEGAKGFAITDEVRVVIAATAVRLTTYHDISMYDRLTEIVVYEDDYRHPHAKDALSQPDAPGIVYGEAHRFGTVVLSWKAVMRGLRHEDDGQDTATHEFAHVLDIADGAFDGTPILSSMRDYQPWAEVMSQHFFALRDGKRTERKVLDTYGAKNEAEFFAVASEVFFEKPEKLQKLLPDLYAQLKGFYRWDPALPMEQQPDPPTV